MQYDNQDLEIPRGTLSSGKREHSLKVKMAGPKQQGCSYRAQVNQGKRHLPPTLKTLSGCTCGLIPTQGLEADEAAYVITEGSQDTFRAILTAETTSLK